MEGGLSSNVNCVLILGGLRTQGFPSGASGKGANAGDVRKAALIPGWGRSPGGGNGSPLQDPCPENPMDRGAWRAGVPRVAKRWTRLKRLEHAQDTDSQAQDTDSQREAVKARGAGSRRQAQQGALRRNRPGWLTSASSTARPGPSVV